MFIPLGDDVDNRSLSMIGLLLIMVCVLVFAVEMRTIVDSHHSGQKIDQFFKTWGLVPKDVAHGRYVGLVSHMFLHGDIMHIAGNLVVLWAFANSLENRLGAVRLLVMFIVWGVAAGLVHALVHWGKPVPLIGASGAIAGMIGAYWMAFGGLTKIRTLVWFIRPRTIMIPTPLFVFIWVMTQVMGASDAKGSGAGIAWFCHLGGFVAGAITMIPYRNSSAMAMTLAPDGQIRFEKRAAESTEPVELPPVEFCPFCHTQLYGMEDAAGNFVRCSNPQCQRIVFLDPQLTA